MKAGALPANSFLVFGPLMNANKRKSPVGWIKRSGSTEFLFALIYSAHPVLHSSGRACARSKRSCTLVRCSHFFSFVVDPLCLIHPTLLKANDVTRLPLNTALPVHTATGVLPLAKYRTSCA